jgi:hypothetical protein
MGLLGSQASPRKKTNYKLLLSSVFSNFSWANTLLNFILKYCGVRTKKLHNISKKLNCLGGQNCLFLGLAVLVFLVIMVKGAYLWLLFYSPWMGLNLYGFFQYLDKDLLMTEVQHFFVLENLFVYVNRYHMNFIKVYHYQGFQQKRVYSYKNAIQCGAFFSRIFYS